MVFDLDTSKGIAQLLAAVRASEMTPAEKNEMRDLLLAYANSHESSTKNMLEQKIATYNLKPVASASVSVSNAREYPFGTSRPTPMMKQPIMPEVGAAVAQSDVKSGPAPEEPVKTGSKPTAGPSAVTEKPSPIVQVPVKSEDVAVNTPASEQPAPTPMSAPAKTAVSEPQPQPQPVSAPVPTTPPKPVNPTPAPAAPAQGQYLARIKEIKADVNQLTGNPAHLIQVTNGAGREYMSALLEAMKALNSGSSPTPAMERLEAAYQTVKKALDGGGSAAPTSAKRPVPQSASAAPPAPQPESSKSAPDTDSDVPVNLPVSSDVSKPSTTAQPHPAPPKPPVSTEEPSSATTEQPTEPARGPSEVIKPAQRLPDPPTIKSGHGEEGLPKPRPVSSLAEKDAEANPQRANSLADSATKPHSPSELPDASSIETSSVSGDPLYTNEVDSGLQQLLAEWPLFKKSGLFGTGPKGREHPLFLKVKDLQIPLLLAGRFEGATQEAKQSITDYMNGWRYEQGIVYEQGETFEHYLRRVIRHIIDLQKQ